MHEGDPGNGSACRRDPGRATDLASIRSVDPGEDLDQRGLAGAVLAEEGMDLARGDVERDAPERVRSAETLVEAGDAKQPSGCAVYGWVVLAETCLGDSRAQELAPQILR